MRSVFDSRMVGVRCRSLFSIFSVSIASMLAMVSCDTRVQKSESNPFAWKVTNPAWDAGSEEAFSAWIQNFGEKRLAGKCRTVEQCLRSPDANTLWDSRDNALRVYTDCADVPFVLRAYFSYKMGLPYALATVFGGRYTPGNHTSCRLVSTGSICDASRGLELDQSRNSNVNSLLAAVVGKVMSGYLRTSPSDESSDTFPIDVRPDTLRPGTVFYDPNGHVLTVFRVEPNGMIRLFDGHPDGSLTTKVFGEMFARGGGQQGGGFRNWRPLQQQGNQNLRPSNESLMANNYGYSATAQYLPSRAYPQGDYYKWVRARMSKGARIDPLREFDDKVKQFCVDIQDRVEAVDIAVRNGLNNRPHPSSLPPNIYGADGDWENYSTPSRDARLRASLRELFRFVVDMRKAVATGDSSVAFSGGVSEFNSELLSKWNNYDASESCAAHYKLSGGNAVRISLSMLVDRIYDLSFDTYHCPELRWGAKPGVGEYNAAACDVGQKMWWYRHEDTLRFEIDRGYGRSTPLGSGPRTPEPINVRAVLENTDSQL